MAGTHEAGAAGKFKTEITREYWIQQDMSVKVREVEKITNNSTDLYIPKGSNQTFDILAIEIGDDENKSILQKAVDSAEITFNGTTRLNFTKKIEADSAELNVKFPSDLNPGKSVTFTLEYVHTGMTEENGALIDFFLNGFAKTSVFEDSSNTTKYTTYVYVPTLLPDANFVVPEGAKKSIQGGYTRYSFEQSRLVDHYVWIQLGRTQFYHFKVTQKVKKSENLNTGNQNRYEIVIPRDIDELQTKQTIYYTKISPAPEWIKEDDEGNLLASFKTKSNYEGTLVFEGYAKIEKKDSEGLMAFGKLSEITQDFQSQYLSPAKYWEVNNSKIQSQAKQIRGTQTNVYDITTQTYEFVVNRIDYSDVKRFGINERQGAVKTLEGGAAVCMEYSDLYLTLMRAQGIPARAAFGYGYDPKLSSSSQESHQWVQVYAPALDEWVSVDVTWGENGPALIGGDLNHFYTHVASKSPNDPPGIASSGFGNLDLESAEYKIDVLSSLPNEDFLTSSELLEKYPYTGENVDEGFIDLAKSKIEATYTNVINGDELSKDQILILVLCCMLFLGVTVVSGGIGKKIFTNFTSAPQS